MLSQQMKLTAVFQQVSPGMLGLAKTAPYLSQTALTLTALWLARARSTSFSTWKRGLTYNTWFPQPAATLKTMTKSQLPKGVSQPGYSDLMTLAGKVGGAARMFHETCRVRWRVHFWFPTSTNIVDVGRVGSWKTFLVLSSISGEVVPPGFRIPFEFLCPLLSVCCCFDLVSSCFVCLNRRKMQGKPLTICCRSYCHVSTLNKRMVDRTFSPSSLRIRSCQLIFGRTGVTDSKMRLCSLT